VAIFNEMQDKGQLSEVLQRRLNMSGAAPAPAVAPELFPVLVYENDRPEWGFLKGENPFALASSSSAAVGTHSGNGIWNPAGGNIIVVVKSITWYPADPCGLVLSVSSTQPFSSTVAGSSTDSRYATAASLRRSNCLVGQRNDYSDPDSLPCILSLNGSATVGSPFVYRTPIILKPGAQLVLIGSNANTALNRVTFEWTERAAMPGELG